MNRGSSQITVRSIISRSRITVRSIISRSRITVRSIISRITVRPIVGLLIGLVLSCAMLGCIVKRFIGPQLTGTCDGACAHYTQCKPGHGEIERNRCLAECPDVFSDRDSLMAYESLTCDDAVDYIDGNAAKTAAHR